MARVKLQVKLIGDYSYEKWLTSWLCNEIHIYKMIDEDEKIYVWKTTSSIGREVPCDPSDSRCYNRWFDKDGNEKGKLYEQAHKGDTFIITASIKEESEYKGEPQTVLQRVRLVEFIEKAPTWEEIQEERAREQAASIKDGDFIYEMPYRQYKENYSDCETIIGSYNKVTGLVKVLVREGRLKPSGVRFQHFSHYCFVNEKGKKMSFYAVSLENAQRQLNRWIKKENVSGEWKVEGR